MPKFRDDITSVLPSVHSSPSLLPSTSPLSFLSFLHFLPILSSPSLFFPLKFSERVRKSAVSCCVRTEPTAQWFFVHPLREVSVLDDIKRDRFQEYDLIF